MKVLIACEISGIVRDAFAERGHDAWSCDLLPTEQPGNHIQCDALNRLDDGWDMMIAHPPCTYLSYAGNRWWDERGRCQLRLKALDFFSQLWEAPIGKICIENPRGCASPTVAKYSQVINPYYFGDKASKPTWLWLKNLSPLVHVKYDTLFEKKTHTTKGEFIGHIDKNNKVKKTSKWYSDSFSLPPEERMKLRSKTFQGIADAMAEQWG